MGYIYSDFGHDGCTCLGERPERCKCGNVCHSEIEGCEDCVKEDHEELQASIHVRLDELDNFITAL